MSPFIEPEPLRRWCDKCQQFTASWLKTDVVTGNVTEECAVHQKPRKTYKDPFYEASKKAMRGAAPD